MTTLSIAKHGAGLLRRRQPRAIERSNALDQFITEVNKRPDAVPDKLREAYREAVKRHGHW